MKPQIALTLGDPAGIGPELVARICADQEVLAAADLLVVGQAALLQAGARAAALCLPQVRLIECGAPAPVTPGLPSAASGALAGAFVAAAARLSLAKEVDAMVTAPLSKEHLNAGGYHYSGHTDMLGELAGGVKPVMMLAGPKLKVSLVTVHSALRQVPSMLTQEALERAILITHQWLQRYWAVKMPRLAVAALNPHAGENGLLGKEEQYVIAPVVERLNAQGFNLLGPSSADTLFWRALKYNEFDAVVCMYHDQGLIPFKMVHFEDGVNISLGLPFIRTSPDHGTAFELAGKGVASISSMKAAVMLAAHLAKASSARPAN